ncbi:MAG: DUF255 domain-containing protein, partial [Vicinamibacterales bacterium]
MTQAATPIAWLEWAEASARARERDRPILLLLETRWSRPSHAFARALEDDDIIPELVNAGFLAARIDAERRPDLADRYGFGDWPSVACLTPAGALLGGAAGTSPPRLVDLLRSVDDAWRTRRADIEQAANSHQAHEPQEPQEPREPVEPPEPPEPMEPMEPMEPLLSDEIRLLLANESPAARAALDRLAADLVDPEDGGVFREPARGSRTAPTREKLLATNADVLDLFTHAGMVLGEPRYLDQARQIASFVGVCFADPLGGFAASLMTDPPEVDATLYVDANARMVSAMVRAGAALDAPALTEAAIASLERVVLATYRPGDGAGHVCDDPDLRGLLVDQIWLAEALMDAHEATGREPYEMLAAELLHYSVRVLGDAKGGGFFDRAEPAHPVKPFALNCRAVRTLRRGVEVCGEPVFAEWAGATLEGLGR